MSLATARVPEVYRLAIDTAIGIAELAGHWQPPQVIIKLPQVQLPDSIGYLDQGAAQSQQLSVFAGRATNN